MQKFKFSQMYVSVAVGIGLVAVIPTANAAPAIDGGGVNNANSITPSNGSTSYVGTGDEAPTGGWFDDIHIESEWDTIVRSDNDNDGNGGFIVDDFNNSTGLRGNVLTVDADDGISGNHQSATNSATWTFDENGFSDVIDDAPALGANTNATSRTALQTENKIESAPGIGNTTTRTAASTVSSVTDGANTSKATQNALGFEWDGNVLVTANKTIDMGNNRVRNVADAVDAGDAVNLRQLSATNARVDDAHARIDTTNTRLDETNVRVDNAHTRINETNVRVDNAHTRINETNVRVDDAHSRINASNTRIDQTNTRIDTHVADTSIRFANTNARIDTVEANLGNRINAVDKKLTGKINETGAVAAAFAQLGQAQTPGKSTFGIAAGGQGSKAGVALGFSHRPVTMKPVVIKASLGASGKTVAGGVGATWEF